jgi:YesN/AraC family two-component response regulator
MYGSGYLVFFYKEPVAPVPLQSKMRNMLIERIEEDKLYLDNELRLPVLAETTGFTTHQISELINSGGENFADLINKYRVKEAMEMLSDPENSHMTTEEIGYASGFNNKTSFYKHFKKTAGLSPMKFRMKHAGWIAEN